MADISGANARYLAMIDREVQEFRSWYNDASQQERAEIVTWLNEAVKLESRLPERQRFSLPCRVNNLSTNEGGEITYNGVVYLTPRVMSDAIDCWNIGEEYVPTNFIDTF